MKNNSTEIKGKHNTAKVFTDDIEQETVEQIRLLCDQDLLNAYGIT